MKLLIIACLTLLLQFSLSAQKSAFGIFDQAADVGKPKLAGLTQYEAITQTYHLQGGGYNIWFGRDEFHYAYRKIKGDFILTANFEFTSKGTDPHRKFGWMVRESADEDAAQISATFHGGDGLTCLQ